MFNTLFTLLLIVSASEKHFEETKRAYGIHKDASAFEYCVEDRQDIPICAIYLEASDKLDSLHLYMTDIAPNQLDYLNEHFNYNFEYTKGL